jgi:deazaflavin-dependent oxidoreductase (nitroreductase family)
MTLTRSRIATLAILVETVAGLTWAVLRFRSERRAGRAPFGGLRRFVNGRLNPLLVESGLAGGRHSEVAVLQHVGRHSGNRYETPVHPTVVGDEVWIPVPYGEASQWARNVLAAGGCDLHIHETDYRLEAPSLVPATESPSLARPLAGTMDWLGMRYLRLHVADAAPAATVLAA